MVAVNRSTLRETLDGLPWTAVAAGFFSGGGFQDLSEAAS